MLAILADAAPLGRLSIAHKKSPLAGGLIQTLKGLLKMNALILNDNAPVVSMTSQEIADLVESRHDSVKRAIERLAVGGIISQPPLVDGQKSANGIIPQEYLVCKRDSYVVVAQLCPQFTARLVDRWQDLEARQSAPVALSVMDILRIAMESETGRLLALEQRDHAIATKAQIGDKKVATAMATASKHSRENTKLKARMGEAAESASVIAVESAAQRKFGSQDWRRLKAYCMAAGLSIGRSFSPGLQMTVNTYPAAAWLEVFNVDLADLFGEVAA